MQLTVDGLGCRRGERQVLVDLTFALPAGRALVVTGPNGAGKSTLLRALAGLLPCEAGRIALEPQDAERSVGERAHFVGHLDAVKPALTVMENLRFWRDLLQGEGDPDAALEALGIAHLAALPAATLSAGQRRRAALARLLLAQRPLWLLDEPLTALDAGAEARLVGVVNDHLRGGGLAVVATHAAIAIEPADRLALGGGR